MKELWLKIVHYLSQHFSKPEIGKMAHVNLKKLGTMTVLMFICSSVLCAADSYALFEDLASHGGKIFTGMREIIYAVSGFGIIAIVIGSIFGNINYKWLTAIIIGLFVIGGTAAIINYMVGETVVDSATLSDTIINGQKEKRLKH